MSSRYPHRYSRIKSKSSQRVRRSISLTTRPGIDAFLEHRLYVPLPGEKGKYFSLSFWVEAGLGRYHRLMLEFRPDLPREWWRALVETIRELLPITDTQMRPRAFVPLVVDEMHDRGIAERYGLDVAEVEETLGELTEVELYSIVDTVERFIGGDTDAFAGF